MPKHKLSFEEFFEDGMEVNTFDSLYIIDMGWINKQLTKPRTYLILFWYLYLSLYWQFCNPRAIP